MSKIKKLSYHEAQKIAAGEVVERPAHIVKELIENAIDAGSKKVVIYIEKGGKQYIRVADDGCGMDQVDAQCCIEKHATSKITSINDLDAINTFGFRGEALASICAVAKVVLKTKSIDSNTGTELSIQENSIGHINSIACNQGTDITVSDLFYAIPARKKFLKADQTEWRHINQLVHAFCLDYPDIHFTFYSNQKKQFNCLSTDSLLHRWQQLYKENRYSMLDISAENKGISISGIISDYQDALYDRSGIYFFVNKRWVKNNALQRALIKGYLNILPEGRYPKACIHITIDCNEIDINIHPRKEEVKFAHPRRVEQLLYTTVKQALEQALSKKMYGDTKGSNLSQSDQNYTSAPTRSDEQFFTHIPQNHYIPTPFQQNRPYTFGADVAKTENHTESVMADQPFPVHSNVQIEQTFAHNIIGQYHKTYIMIEKEDGLFLIDQHAAHERILYERFGKKFDAVATIQLIAPIMVRLDKGDLKLITPFLDYFSRGGITVDLFGEDQLIVTATPVYVQHICFKDLIGEFVGWIKQDNNIDNAQLRTIINEKLRAQMACKAAIKAGDELSREKMEQLINDLDKVDNRFTCPHGRPTGWLLQLSDIEKKFKRRK